jgi:hypothetical protein
MMKCKRLLILGGVVLAFGLLSLQTQNVSESVPIWPDSARTIVI